MKKYILLIIIVLFMLACVITPPEGLLPATPTICVECVQATICAENATGDGCPVMETPTPAIVLPTIIPTTQEPAFTEEPTQDIFKTESPDLTATISMEPSLSPTEFLESEGTVFPTSTQEVFPTSTESPDILETPTQESETPVAAPTVRNLSWIYKAQSGSPKYATNFAHPDKACNWGGVAGQIFGSGGAPQTNIVLVVTGRVNGVPYDLLGFTGSAVKYGASAYEIEFPDGPIRTMDTFTIQLFDLDGVELSAPLPFDTYADCNKNLVIYNFTLVN